MVRFVFPLPLLPLTFPLLLPLVGMADRPIPVETRLKPDPPGLSRGLTIEFGNVTGSTYCCCGC